MSFYEIVDTFWHPELPEKGVMRETAHTFVTDCHKPPEKSLQEPNIADRISHPRS